MKRRGFLKFMLGSAVVPGLVDTADDLPPKEEVTIYKWQSLAPSGLQIDAATIEQEMRVLRQLLNTNLYGDT